MKILFTLLKLVLLFVFIINNNLNLWSQASVLVIDPKTEEYLNVGKKIDILEDKEGNLTFEQAKKQKFTPSEQDVINKGFNANSKFWFRIILDNTATHPEKEWVVDIEWPVLTYVKFYLPDGKVMQAGEGFDINNRTVFHRNLVFPINLRPGKIDTFYIQSHSYTPNVFPVNVETSDQWKVNNVLDDILLSAFFGALIIMLIYNVLLYISVNDNSYIPYILYISSIGLLVLSIRGVTYQYFTGTNYYFNFLARNGMAAIAGFCIGWFAIEFLNVKKKFPKFYKVLYICQIIWLIILTLILINVGPFHPGSQIASDIALNGFAALHPILLFTVGVMRWRSGYKPAKFFVFGFSFLLFGIVVQVLKNLGIFNQNLYTEYTFQYGILIEQALLSIALGDKINVVKDEKEKAQAEAIRALTENERIISEQNQILEIKVEERTRELNDANNELTSLNEEIKQTLDYVSHQNEIIEEKNKDITESIQYAWRIQNAILPDVENIKRYVPDFFVFYRPKDIVSGDFFWFARNDNANMTFLATVDCTGHGVPGAFMSVIGYNVLNRIVMESGITDTDAILTALDLGVRSALKQDRKDDKKTNDGMDLTLVAIDHQTNKVYFTGAQTTLYHLRNGEIQLIKGDKFPVGGSQSEVKTFTSKEIELLSGDRIYMYTDGIVDQFGGPQRRKFTPKRLQQMILDLEQVPMSQQLEPITETLDAWKGEVEQIDDMSLMGFQLS